MEKEDSYSELTKTGLGLIVLCGLVFLAAGKVDWAKGFALGGIFSVINFFLLKRTFQKRLGLTGRRAKIQGFGQIISRYALLAVPMLVAYRMEQFSLPATIVGLFTMQLSIIFYYGFWIRIFKTKDRNSTSKD